MSDVTIVDSGICNLGSIARAFERNGGRVAVATSAAHVSDASRLVLPGVGSFPAGMRALTERGLADAIRDFAATGKPLLGVCLGMQLLFTTGEEFGETEGLGLIGGRVRELKAPTLPHMGWNQVQPAGTPALLRGLPPQAYFYFVHTYICVPDDPADIAGRTEYGETFCSVVNRGNLWGMQAHPEKSQHCGATVLKNFLSHP